MRSSNFPPTGAMRPHDQAGSGGNNADQSDRFRAPLPGLGRSPVWTGITWMDGLVPAAGLAQQNTGPVSSGGQRASGAGYRHGGDVGQTGGISRGSGPCFKQSVATGGYSWWYVDALSDDGRQGLTIIGFIGSVFSPYYAWARQRGGADPRNHCAINIGLYNTNGKRWAMTERGQGQLVQEAHFLGIGPSSFHWDGQRLRIDLDEVTAPFPSRIRGQVTVYPDALIDHRVALDAAGVHHWQPIAPCARVEVNLTHPQLRWAGSGYVDSNHGSEPLEDAFVRWDWSRATMKNGDSLVLYDVSRRSGGEFVLAQRFSPDGRIVDIDPPPAAALPASMWRLNRSTRCDANHKAIIARSLEDGPFYARSALSTQIAGEALTSIHESLSLDRFRSPVVQMMLPFRMPRRG